MQLCRLIVSSLAVGVIGLSALAQDPPTGPGAPPGRGGQVPGGPGGAAARPRLSPEKAKAAWEVEAKGVAKSLTLNDELTTKTVAAYSEARESQLAATEKLMREIADKERAARSAGEGDQGGGEGADTSREQRAARRAETQKQFAELNKAERDKLQAALAKFLSEEQTTKALATLGTFNPRWDAMVDAVIGFKLEEAKNTEALTAIQTFVEQVGKAGEMGPRGGSPDPDARKQLTDTMKKLLSEEQFGQFQRIAGGRPAGARGEGAPEGGRGGAGGAGRGGAGGAGGTGNRGGGEGGKGGEGGGGEGGKGGQH
jgi:hypothetical protein